MDKLKKLYDEISKVLTWYENPSEYPFAEDDFNRNIAAELYTMLVSVQREILSKIEARTEREHYEIQYGWTDSDSYRVNVIANKYELDAICASLVRYARKYLYDGPIACVAYPNGGASFKRYDGFCYCDCM